MTTLERRESLFSLVHLLLSEKGIDTFEKRVKADYILNLLENEKKSEFEKLEISKENFNSMLSAAIREKENSQIVRKESSQGYFVSTLSNAAQSLLSKVEQDENKKDETERSKEKLLYPVFEKWLLINGNRAMDTSAFRGMKRWGNPDITGLKIITDYGQTDIEITTIEVKVTNHRWEYDVFEAISHRRFANQAYFAFAVDGEAGNYRNKKLSYYSSLYEIGILVLTMSKENYNNLVSGKLKIIDQNDEFFDIIELYPPKYHFVNLEYKREFLESISVPKDHKMHSWGKNPIE